jgi:hypothetical protein
MFEGTIGLIISRKSTDNTMLKRKRTKAQTHIYKALNRQLILEPRKPHQKLGVGGDTKGVIGIRISKKNRQQNDQLKSCNDL